MTGAQPSGGVSVPSPAALKGRLIIGSDDDQHIGHSCCHGCRERIVDHRPVVDRQQPATDRLVIGQSRVPVPPARMNPRIAATWTGLPKMMSTRLVEVHAASARDAASGVTYLMTGALASSAPPRALAAVQSAGGTTCQPVRPARTFPCVRVVGRYWAQMVGRWGQRGRVRPPRTSGEGRPPTPGSVRLRRPQGALSAGGSVTPWTAWAPRRG